MSLTGLAAVLAWNFGSGPFLADVATDGAVEKHQWLVSWLVLLAGLAIGFSPAQPYGLDWYVSGFVLASGLFIIGLLRLNVALCLLGVLVTTIGVAVAEDFQHLAADVRRLPRVALAVQCGGDRVLLLPPRLTGSPRMADIVGAQQ